MQRNRVVEVLMNPNEWRQQRSKAYHEAVKDWQPERIKALSEMKELSLHRLSGLLGITRRTLRFLISGHYTPSPTMCRRMEMLESDIRDGKEMAADILPRRSEMRRRLLLFRSWWSNRDPSRALPEITVHIQVRWGKGVINRVEIPPAFLPRLRISSFAGLVETVRAMTEAMRRVSKGYKGLLWKVQEEDFWSAYASDTIPKIVEERAKHAAKGARARKWRPVKDV